MASRILESLLTDPKALFQFITNGKEGLHRYATARLLQTSVSSLLPIYSAMASNERFLESIRSKTAEAGIKLGEIARPLDLYAVCRVVRPHVVVETGVANGISSAFILQALADNDLGQLYSIDTPIYAMLPKGRDTGWIIPEWLRARWELLVGTSREILPDLVKRLNAVDVFLHDADAAEMMFEFESVWQKLAEGGLIISDHVDIPASGGSFYKFAKKVGRKPARLYSRLGAIRK